MADGPQIRHIEIAITALQILRFHSIVAWMRNEYRRIDRALIWNPSVTRRGLFDSTKIWYRLHHVSTWGSYTTRLQGQMVNGGGHSVT